VGRGCLSPLARVDGSSKALPAIMADVRASLDPMITSSVFWYDGSAPARSMLSNVIVCHFQLSSRPVFSPVGLASLNTLTGQGFPQNSPEISLSASFVFERALFK
jgi:hypothetical protein